MEHITTTRTLAQPFWPVNTHTAINFSCLPDSMIHHKVSLSEKNNMIVSYSRYRCKAYGVSPAYRVLSPQLLFKKQEYIRDCLYHVLGLTPGQIEVTFRLLCLWAYYGQVYPKEAQVSAEPGCSKATFWRTVRVLKEGGYIGVVNRFVIRHEAQISNLYRLDRLVVVLARYLAEHGTGFLEKWLTPALTMPARLFWDSVLQDRGARAGPLIPAFGGL